MHIKRYDLWLPKDFTYTALTLSLPLLLSKMSLEVGSWPEVGSSWSKEKLWVGSVKYFTFISLLYRLSSFSLPFFLYACLSFLLSLSLQACRLKFIRNSQFHTRATRSTIHTTHFDDSQINTHNRRVTVNGKGWLVIEQNEVTFFEFCKQKVTCVAVSASKGSSS